MKDFEIIELKPPKGGYCYMKRSKYLDDEKYSHLPQFVVGRSTKEGKMRVFEGDTFLVEMPLSEFDRVFEMD